MLRKLRQVIIYTAFLAIGVFLFYLASLDILRGSLAVESETVFFSVGRGLENCTNDQRQINIASASAPVQGLRYTITPANATDLISEGTLGDKPLSLCLNEGDYAFHIDGFTEGVVVLEGIDKTDILAEDMSKASWPGIVLSALMGYLAIVSRGLRWELMLEPMGYKVNRWRSIHAVAFSYFANFFIPRGGELARCVAFNQTEKVPVDRLFGTVISERVVDLVLLVAITGLAFITNLDAFVAMLSGSGGGQAQTAEEAESGIGLGQIIGILVIAGVAALFLLRRSTVLRGAYNRLMAFLKGVGEGLRSVLKMRRKGAFIAHTLFIWAMYYFSTWVIFKSIEGTSDIPMHQSLFIMVAGGFGMVIPAPGGIGSYHWMVKLAFLALGLSGTLAFAAANVMWLTQNIMIILTGGVGYLILMAYRIRANRSTLDGNG